MYRIYYPTVDLDAEDVINHAGGSYTVTDNYGDVIQQGKMIMIDDDLADKNEVDLKVELMALRNAVRKHRDAKGNARCWQNNLELYGELPEQNTYEPMAMPKDEFLRNCEKFYDEEAKCDPVGCDDAEPEMNPEDHIGLVNPVTRERLTLAEFRKRYGDPHADYLKKQHILLKNLEFEI